MWNRTSMLLVLLSVLLSACCVSAAITGDRVLLSDVSALTFRKDKWTRSRRSSPIPELKCISGPCHINVQTVQCRNVGHDGDYNVQWKCEAELPNGISFASINVNCEGYAYENDRYILKGSCGLEFGLTSTTSYDDSTRSSYGSHHDSYSAEHERVLLTDITALTFRKGKMTKSRRTHPIPELKCISGPCHIDISAVQCKNSGTSDEGDVQWKCSAELPKGISFSKINVNCEGYHNSQDDGVLKGSCGLEFGLKGNVPRDFHRHQRRERYESEPLYSEPEDAQVLPYIIGGLLLIVILITPFVPTNSLLHNVHHHYGDAYSSTEQGGGGFWTGLVTALGLSWLFNRRRRDVVRAPPPLYRSDDNETYRSTSPERPMSPGTHTATGYGGTTRR